MHAAVWLVNVNLASTLLCQKGAIQLTAPSLYRIFFQVSNPNQLTQLTSLVKC